MPERTQAGSSVRRGTGSQGLSSKAAVLCYSQHNHKVAAKGKVSVFGTRLGISAGTDDSSPSTAVEMGKPYMMLSE